MPGGLCPLLQIRCAVLVITQYGSSHGIDGWARICLDNQYACVEDNDFTMTFPQITVYGACWCPDCRRSKSFLGEHQIPYEWIDIEQDSEAEQFVIQTNNGKRIIPTVVFADGSHLTEPTNAELAAKLNLKTTANRSFYPHIVVGGGLPGLTAAIYTAREGIDTLVIERGSVWRSGRCDRASSTTFLASRRA